MDSEELQRLKRNWLLLDTSVLIRISRLGDDIQQPLWEMAQKYECTLVLHDFIAQEFLAYTILQDAYNDRLKLVNQYPVLPVTKEEREKAVHMSRLYAVSKIKTPSVVDCISAAMLRKYKGKMYVLTNDLKDFPTAIFKPFYLWPFDQGQQIDIFGFLELDNGKVAAAEKSLRKASQS